MIVLITLSCVLISGLLVYQTIQGKEAQLTEIGAYETHTDGLNFDIDLASNSSTGYSWDASDVDTENVSLEDPLVEAYKQKGSATGVGDHTVFHGEVEKSGTTSFVLNYRQSWDGGETELALQVTIVSNDSSIQSIKLSKLSEE